MQAIGPAAEALAQWPGSAGSPRITPIHDRLDRRHNDLAFHVDTAGRRWFRVLIARDRSLFAPGQAGLRNASNFYDSARDGLLPFDGPPCFFLVPRSALHGMLPTRRLYYTLIAYDNDFAERGTHAHAPESLGADAPAVTVADEFSGGSIGLMFGTPVNQLMPVGQGLAFADLAEEEVGEDLDLGVPMEIGLDDDEPAPEDDDRIGAAAALDAGDTDLDEEDTLGYGAAAYDDHADDYNEDYAVAPAWAASDDKWRPPVMEGAQAAGFEESGEDDWDDPQAEGQAAELRALADDYDDGYGLPPLGAPGPGANGSGDGRSSGDGYRTSYGDRAGPADEAGAYGAEHEPMTVHAFHGSGGDPMPALLPDEDADGSYSAQAGDDDGVEITGASAYGQAFDAEAPPAQVFDIEACKALLARIMPFESGTEGFRRIGADGEYAGHYGTAHPAYRRYHLGLTFGAFPFVQEHGTLGLLLELMRDRDRATFERIFGGAAQTVIDVTNTAEGPRSWESPDGLSARLRPVEGARLWEEPWLNRFREAAAHPLFQGAQNELAARLYVEPVLPVAARVGLDSERALTLLVDRAVQMGPEAGLAWVLDAVSPLPTPAQRQQALARLGHQDLRAFQGSHQLPESGAWDTLTHATLIGALRTRQDSPVPIPTREQMIQALLRHAGGSPWAPRMQRLSAAIPVDRVFRL